MPRFRGSHSDKNKMFVRNVDTKENLSEENLWKLYKKKYDNVLAKLTISLCGVREKYVSTELE